jgi:hypothetical protein
MAATVCVGHTSTVCVKEVEFPLKEANSLDGIIFYLTRKHGGNVHENGIVTITSKSVYKDKPSYNSDARLRAMI